MPETDDRAEILRLEQKRCAALKAGDTVALGEIFADDLIHIHGNGHVDGKVDFLKGVESKFIFHELDRGDLTLRIYGDVAVVVGPVTQTLELRGHEGLHHLKGVCSQTWVRNAGGWQQNTCHMHFLPV